MNLRRWNWPDNYPMLAEKNQQASGWIDVVCVDDIPQLGARVIKTESANIAIFRNAQDQIFAIKDQCPHKQGPLSQGIVHGSSVTCPLHNWKIDLSNGQVLGPDEGCVNTYAVRVESNRVYIKL